MDPNQHHLESAGDLESEALKSRGAAVVAFVAPWSRPCRILSTALNAVARCCTGKVRIVRINADDYPELSIWYDIQSVPTLLFLVNGLVVGRVVGTASKQAILSKLKDCGALA